MHRRIPSRFPSPCILRTGLLALGVAMSGSAMAAPPDDAADPYAWLEDVSAPRSLDWVHAENARTDAAIGHGERFDALQAGFQAILDSDAKIPSVQKIGAYYYNFWKDAAHVRGIWRRTTLAEYRKAEPAWETVLDLDALSAAENTPWVWHGASCLRPQYRDCLIALSRGGSDADVTREFDLDTRQWRQHGFERPESKGGMEWINAGSTFVYTDFGPDSMTRSGYPRIVKRWTRGTPMAAAKLIYAGQPDDMYIAAVHDATPGFERSFVVRTIAFYRDQWFLLGAHDALLQLPVPDSAKKSVHREWLLLELREPWTVAGSEYPAGSLLAARFDDAMAGKATWRELFRPDARTSLEAATWTRDRLVLNLLDDVKNRLEVLTPRASGPWSRAPLPGAPGFGTLVVDAVDAMDSNDLWLTATDYLTPTTLALVTPGHAPDVLKTMPTFFDASRDVIEQHFATSKDGTRVPYFLVRPRDLVFDGAAPALLYGYGGFEVSLTPSYSGIVGKGWLERGGVYAVANIRGGGEYGPRWHQAALKANRHKAYEDFVAVARDLVTRKITSPAHLGAMGGSNGGLLVGNMLTQYPDDFGAFVIQVPLLDMKRYSHLLAGASWMAEYGDPDSADWNFIRGFSPYQLFDPARRYPPTLIWTTTRDDRVHPGHARKMAAKMRAADEPVHYFENTEGGHGAGATNAQTAHVWALTYAFLWQTLGSTAAPTP